MTYETPAVVDYGDVRDITAQRVFEQYPDAEAPGEIQDPIGGGTIDDTTGPCKPEFQQLGLCH